MKKLIFRGPVQTASGYGVHARMLLKALDDSGKFDITVLSIPWGATPLIYDDSPEQIRIRELASKFNPNEPISADVSVQVSIPNEFSKLAPKNVCVTAGIETDRVAKLWQEKTNEVADVLVVPSVHSARGFTTGIYGERRGPTQVLLRKPLYILPEWVNADVFNTSPVPEISGMEDMPEFNFIAVGLGLDRAEGEDRKNFSLLIRWFCEQFKNNPKVGLVLKLSMVNHSEVDFRVIKERISIIKQQTGCGQLPKIKLIHGRLSDLELAAFYKHPKVKAFISTTHGEGYGLPIIEAAACGLPVLATNWSGHLDFLRVDGKNKFVPLDYNLVNIPDGAVWENVLEKGTRWADPIENDVKIKMAKVVMSYDKPKQWANELASHISENINKNLGAIWAEDVYKLACGDKVSLTKNLLVKTRPSDKTLDDVTLVAVSDDRVVETANAMSKTMQQVGYKKALLFTSQDYSPEDKRIEVIKLEKMIDSVKAYDEVVSKKVANFVDTRFVQVVQWDGYVLNGSAWDDDFFKYDYIGAPWFWNEAGMNSGFCLQSVALLKEMQKDDYVIDEPYDVLICNKYRQKLESAGFKLAPPQVSKKFSVENLPYEGQFGWHGENPFIGER